MMLVWWLSSPCVLCMWWLKYSFDLLILSLSSLLSPCVWEKLNVEKLKANGPLQTKQTNGGEETNNQTIKHQPWHWEVSIWLNFCAVVLWYSNLYFSLSIKSIKSIIGSFSIQLRTQFASTFPTDRQFIRHSNDSTPSTANNIHRTGGRMDKYTKVKELGRGRKTGQWKRMETRSESIESEGFAQQIRGSHVYCFHAHAHACVLWR